MEMESILKFLENKTLLVTGATGFLSKILVEKLLRSQPNIKKLYLLVRATDTKSTNQRLQDESSDPYYNKLIHILATRCMTQVVYFCSGDLSPQEYLHYGLAAPLYTHFTSPIRRYADVAVHRLLAASLGISKLPTIFQDKPQLTSSAAMAVGYGKGRLAFLAGGPKTVLDVIPGDMVVNATLVAMVAHASQQGETGFYHVGSSVRNPLYIAELQTTIYHYFQKNLCVNKEGKPVIVGHFKLLRSMKRFNRYVYLHYLLPLQGFKLVNAAFCQYYEGRYTKLKRTINVVLRMFDIYKPYLFFKGVFDDRNTQKLWLQAREQIRAETDEFYFDPEGIIWEDYTSCTHMRICGQMRICSPYLFNL